MRPTSSASLRASDCASLDDRATDCPLGVELQRPPEMASRLPVFRQVTRRGFSLIEVMMTSLILGVGVVGLASMYTSSARGVGSSRHRETATQIAVQRIERL